MSSPEHKQKIWNMIKEIKVGMLTTAHDGTIWFYTDIRSEKVFEVEKDSQVGLTFEDQNNETYVSLTGTARLTQDKDLIEKYWNPFVAAWFPDGKDGGNVAMIEIKIRKGEHWNATSSRTIQLFEFAKASLTDDYPDLGENQKFGTR